MSKSLLTSVLAVGVSFACAGGTRNQAEADWTIDQRSYNLGGIGAFAEMVAAGVKRLALSAPMDPAEMDALLSDAERIAADHGVGISREADFLITDLFPATLTDGKHVLLMCEESTRQDYLALKELKRQLVESGRYDNTARTDLARRLGALLSYSDEKINSLIASNPDRRTP
jgi:hypothetical protein